MNGYNIINDGVTFDPGHSGEGRPNTDNAIFFNFGRDYSDDIIYLTPKLYNRKFHYFRGFNIYYAYRFEYKNSRKKLIEPNDDSTYGDMVNTVRNLLKYGEDYLEADLEKMIEVSLDRFESLKLLSDFGVIITMPSGSDLNKRIIKQIKNRVGKGTKIIDAPFAKNLYNELEYHRGLFRKMTPSGQQYLLRVLKGLKKKSGKVEIKDIPANIRRYIYNFLKIRQALKIKNADVLLVDDTIGSGVTFLEAERLIRKYTPNDVWLYAFLKDY